MKKIIATIAVLGVCAVASAAPVNFSWGNTATAYDYNGVALTGGQYTGPYTDLGALVQVWRTTSSSVTEDPNAVHVNDTLLWNSWCRTDYGDGIFSGSGVLEVAPTDYLYIRFWNVGPTSGTADGDNPTAEFGLGVPVFGVDPSIAYFDTGPMLVGSATQVVLPDLVDGSGDGTLLVGQIGSNGSSSSTSPTHTQNMWVAVPEPSTWMLASIGVLAVGLRRRFTKKA